MKYQKTGLMKFGKMFLKVNTRRERERNFGGG